MPTTTRLAHLAAILAIAGAPPALADHIPGHDDRDPVFPVPIPGQEFFTGGILFVTAIGPIGGSEITNTRLDITYVSDGQTPAADLLLSVGLLIETPGKGTQFQEIEVTGADLGFTSGPGVFKGSLETTALNGLAVEGFFPPYSIVDLGIGATTGGIEGTAYFVDSFIYFDLALCPWDLDGDGQVGFGDLLGTLSAWGTDPAGPPDFDGSGSVGFEDLLEVLTNWGSCP